MGSYDKVLVPCPKCRLKVEFQSKGGPCDFLTYELHEAPEDVLSDINRHSPHICTNCKTKFGVSLEQRAFVAVPIVWEDQLELEFLRFFFEKIQPCLGPADSEIIDMIKKEFTKKTGKPVPEDY
jgi:hypothetical protein